MRLGFHMQGLSPPAVLEHMPQAVTLWLGLG